jgi:putative transposase
LRLAALAVVRLSGTSLVPPSPSRPGENEAKPCDRVEQQTCEQRRVAVSLAREAHDVSERRACSIIGADRNAMRYRHRRVDDAEVRTRLKELAAERRRFGWRGD